MPILKDARGNEFRGYLDALTGNTVTDARTISAVLGALNAETFIDLNGDGICSIDVRNGANATLTFVFEATIDNANYFPIPAVDNQTESVVESVALAAAQITKIYIAGVSAYRRVRVRISAFTSGNITVSLRSSRADYAIYAKPFPSQLHVTAVAAVNTALTATLPAPGIGLYHYITRFELRKQYSVVGVAAGAGVIITSTNLPGNPAWNTEQNATAAGANVPVINENYAGNPLKSLVANTATTFVAPAQLQTIWRWNVSYFVGA